MKSISPRQNRKKSIPPPKVCPHPGCSEFGFPPQPGNLPKFHSLPLKLGGGHYENLLHTSNLLI